MNTQPESDIYTSVDELARYLGISRQSCYRGLANGDIPAAVRIGRRFIIPRAAVRSWLSTAGGKVPAVIEGSD
jgi:excisionase family DNA binding protein